MGTCASSNNTARLTKQFLVADDLVEETRKLIKPVEASPPVDTRPIFQTLKVTKPSSMGTKLTGPSILLLSNNILSNLQTVEISRANNGQLYYSNLFPNIYDWNTFDNNQQSTTTSNFQLTYTSMMFDKTTELLDLYNNDVNTNEKNTGNKNYPHHLNRSNSFSSKDQLSFVNMLQSLNIPNSNLNASGVSGIEGEINFKKKGSNRKLVKMNSIRSLKEIKICEEIEKLPMPRRGSASFKNVTFESLQRIKQLNQINEKENDGRSKLNIAPPEEEKKPNAAVVQQDNGRKKKVRIIDKKQRYSEEIRKKNFKDKPKVVQPITQPVHKNKSKSVSKKINSPSKLNTKTKQKIPKMNDSFYVVNNNQILGHDQEIPKIISQNLHQTEENVQFTSTPPKHEKSFLNYMKENLSPNDYATDEEIPSHYILNKIIAKTKKKVQQSRPQYSIEIKSLLRQELSNTSPNDKHVKKGTINLPHDLQSGTSQYGSNRPTILLTSENKKEENNFDFIKNVERMYGVEKSHAKKRSQPAAKEWGVYEQKLKNNLNVKEMEEEDLSLRSSYASAQSVIEPVNGMGMNIVDDSKPEEDFLFNHQAIGGMSNVIDENSRNVQHLPVQTNLTWQLNSNSVAKRPTIFINPNLIKTKSQ